MSKNFNINITDLEGLSDENMLDININEKSSCSKKNHLGSIFYQIQNQKGISLFEWKSYFNKDTKLSSKIDSPIFGTHFMLDGNSEYGYANNVKQVNKNRNNIWSLAPNEATYSNFRKNTQNSSFAINFDDSYMQVLVERHPDLLYNIYKKHLNGESLCMCNKEISTSGEMSIIIDQIKNANIMGSVKELYIEAKVSELLALQFLQVNNYCNLYYHINKASDIDKIHEAKDILLTDINTPPSIRELAQMVGLNEKKLKYGFKQVHNNTIFGSLYEHKMLLAKDFLQYTDKSILDIALDCGYEHASHFSTAFKRKYGMSPKQYQICHK